MPMIDLLCPNGHEYEAFRHPSQVRDCEPCEECGAEAQRIYKLRREHSYEGLSEPLVVFRRPDGTYAVPANRDALKPAEYERVELRTNAEIRLVEKAINQEEYNRWNRSQEGKQRLLEEVQGRNRSELRNRMQHFTEHQRDFARFAMEKNNQKPREKFQRVFYFEALSMDSSNREAYRGEETGCRGRK